VFAMAYASGALDTLTTAAPISLSVKPDLRWHRCEIKCTSLMGSILPMLDGRHHNAQEAILIRDGFVSEGSSSNIFVVRANNLITPPIDTDPSILHGTMRTLAMDAARKLGFEVSIRPIEEAELATADEIWVTGSGRVLASCVSLNGKVFGGGKPAKMACAVINSMRLAVENLLVKTP